MQNIDISCLRQCGGRIEWIESILNIVFRVVEIKDEEVFAQLAQIGGRTVQPRKCLHCQNACQRLVHIHRTKFGLVKTCEVFVGHHENAIIVRIELFGGLRIRESVHACFREGEPIFARCLGSQGISHSLFRLFA